MTDNELQLLKTLCRMTQAELLKNLPPVLRTFYTEENIIVTPDYIYAVGSAPVALIAHLDTVHLQPPVEIFYDQEQMVMWSPQGIGADDRAGVFAALQVLQTCAKDKLPTIIFTTEEETGCMGAWTLAGTFQQPLSPLKYIIQLDRRGFDDCVFYDCENPDFTKYVESFGFKEQMGSMSDISAICPEWGVAGVNLSVGYFNEHTFSEHLCVDILFTTIQKVVNMVMAIDEAESFEYIENPNSIYARYGVMRSYDYPGYDDEPIDTMGMSIANAGWGLDHPYRCSKCGKFFRDVDMIRGSADDGSALDVCMDCYRIHHIDCPNCQVGLIVPEEIRPDGKCPYCLEDLSV